jgi:hypothetical protein
MEGVTVESAAISGFDIRTGGEKGRPPPEAKRPGGDYSTSSFLIA